MPGGVAISSLLYAEKGWHKALKIEHKAKRKGLLKGIEKVFYCFWELSL
jgi:hypothetical protein